MSVGKGDTTHLRSRKPKTMVPYQSSNNVFPDDNLTADTTKPKLIDTKTDVVIHELTTYQSNIPSNVNGNRHNDVDEGGGSRSNHIDVQPSTSLIGDNGQIVEETAFIDGTDLEPLISHEDEDHETIDLKLEESTETSLSICLQVTLPYLIAGLGMVLAGLVLDTVQHWPVFTEVSEIFVLVPSLLGLKGNLEMTLASRLSTQANIGNMDKSSEKWKMIGGNMALIQAQAIVVGFLASVVAMVMGWIPDGVFNVQHGLLLCASSMCTAAVASFILGSIMVGVVLISNKCNINPDNVATPIAASLGDLTTLALLSGVACLLYKAIGNQHWLAPVMIAFFILLTPLWIYVSVHNHYTHDVVYSGWVPVLSAMVISSIGGLILDFAVTYYSGIAVFQPVINGVGGNLVAVQASRISTSLHQVCKPGKLPNTSLKGCPNCPSAFFGKSLHAKAARVLIALVIPGHLIFMYTISFMKAGHTSITFIFSLMYLTAAVLQVVVLLYIANWMVHFIWRKGDDPDNVAIPYLTAIGDLLGTAFLALAFHILFLIGDRDADGGKIA